MVISGAALEAKNLRTGCHYQSRIKESDMRKQVLVFGAGFHGVDFSKLYGAISSCDIDVEGRKKKKLRSRKEAAILRNMHNKK
jgi:predicted RNA-binding protein with PIN domain